MKTHALIWGIILLQLCFCCKNSAKKDQHALVDGQETESMTKTTVAPIMLDDIHYYTLDRDACNTFFETNFHSRPMLEDSPNPFEFIDFQLVRSGQSTINISEQGPFPGIRVGDPKRWERKLVTPDPDNPPRYGVHWLALGTKDLTATKAELNANGAKLLYENYQLPHSNENALLYYGPDFNLLVVVENRSDTAETPYYIDHILLLVEDLQANIQFYEEVLGATTVKNDVHMAIQHIAGQKFILIEPEGLGINRDKVIKRDPKVFRPDIDHLGFLYKDIRPAYDNAVAKGYQFLSKPVKINYYDKPTLYTFGITYSPDGLQIELFQEEGRTTSRKTFKQS